MFSFRRFMSIVPNFAKTVFSSAQLNGKLKIQCYNQLAIHRIQHKDFTSSRVFVLAGILGLIDSKEDTETVSGESKIINMIKLAKLSQQRGDPKKCEELLHLAFQTAKELGHQQAQKYIIDELANNAFELGDYRKAERLFIEMMKRLIADGTLPSDNAIIHISAKLACLYGMFKDDLKAREGFQFCIRNLQEKLSKGTDDFDTEALYSLALSWYGEFLHSRGANKEASSLFQESLTISKTINGPRHPHSLLQLNNMAAAYSSLNRFDEAADCLKEAITHSGLESEDLPFYYINLTNIYLTQLGSQDVNKAEIIKSASEAAKEASRLAMKLGDREAIMEAERCLLTLEQEQTRM